MNWTDEPEDILQCVFYMNVYIKYIHTYIHTYVFGGEIRKATTFCKRVLMKPTESLPLNN